MHFKGIVSLNVHSLQVFIFITYFDCVVTWYLEVNKSEFAAKEVNIKTSTNQLLNITSSSEFIEAPNDTNETNLNHRTKRQSGGGKYAEAALMGQTKVVRLWLQMFANTWSKIPVGGPHPLHKSVPKPVVQLFKQRIGEFLFPKLEKTDEDE